MTDTRVFLWNVKVGRRPEVVRREVARLMRLYKVDVGMFQEAHGYVEALHDIPGTDVIAARGEGEARGNPMVFDSELEARRRAAIRCETNWVGPKQGNPHRGRVFSVGQAEGITYVNVHRTRPGWSARGRAFAEEYEKLLDFARSTRGPLVIGGDQNIGTRPGGDRGRHTPWALAEAIDGDIITTAPGHIDYVVVRGIEGTAHRKGKYGSDHNAVLLKLHTTKKGR